MTLDARRTSLLPATKRFWLQQRRKVMQTDASIEAAYPDPGVAGDWRRAQMEERPGGATRHYRPNSRGALGRQPSGREGCWKRCDWPLARTGRDL